MFVFMRSHLNKFALKCPQVNEMSSNNIDG